MRLSAKMNDSTAEKEFQHIIEDSGEDDDDDDDSTTRSSSPDRISYHNRPEWSDVEPINIKTHASIMDIKYTARYEEAFGYFRAMLVRDELSERSLALTADCIDLQASNFSVWYFRRRILKQLRHHQNAELGFVEKVIENEPKNYQVWHHRKTIVEWLKDGSHEKHLTASILRIDSKNYHAWQHRQWALKEFALWDGELEFTDTQLAMDIRNNSAWNHRYFVTKETRRFEDTDWLTKELRLVQKRVEQLPTNESSWSYLRGLLTLAFGCINNHAETRHFCYRILKELNNRPSHLMAFVLDMLREDLAIKSNKNERDSVRQEATQICRALAETDQVRARYWKYIEMKIKET